MKKILVALFLLISFTLSAQTLLSYEKIEHLDKEALNKFWKDNGVPKLITPLISEIDIYELKYYTKLPNGEQVIASGLYYVPLDYPYEVATMQYNHGTAMTNRTGDSYDYNGESTICKIFAADGYAVAWQDYIGLGKATGFHPYQHLETEGQSGVDLLRAVKEINAQIGLEVNDQLFIAGYSQGGHATLAVHKTIQENYDDEFTVTASSPMSGAHDMSGVQNEIMEVEYAQPHYLPYLLYGYQQIYNVFPNNEEFRKVFRPEYRHVLDKILAKEHGLGDINSMLPSKPFDMIEPYFFDQYKNNPDFLFTKVLKENNTYNWVPEAPVQFCYCLGDEEVYYKNSLVAMEYMKANGAKRIIDRKVSNTFNHRECADYAVMYTKFFFDSFRNGFEKGRKGNFIKNTLVKTVVKIEEKKKAKKK
ncbi:MAG: lipase family protein [Chitinophagales bacterium]